MEVRATVRHTKLLVDSTIEALKLQQESSPNTRYEVSLTFQMEPGELTDSATLSYLDALSSALAKFGRDEKAAIVLNLIVVSRQQVEIMQTIEDRFQRVVQVEQAAQPPKLVLPDGAK